MTIDELRAVPVGTTIYVPDGWFVTDWVAGGMVADTNYYALIHPPERWYGATAPRPYIVGVLELLPACLDRREAWAYNVTELHARIAYIMNTELKKP